MQTLSHFFTHRLKSGIQEVNSFPMDFPILHEIILSRSNKAISPPLVPSFLILKRSVYLHKYINNRIETVAKTQYKNTRPCIQSNSTYNFSKLQVQLFRFKRASASTVLSLQKSILLAELSSRKYSVSEIPNPSPSQRHKW